MLLIVCPHCGPRPSGEFSYRGEVVARPRPGETGPSAWRAYLYERENVAGEATEEWFHGSGCRRVLVVRRDTTTNRISSVRDRSDG